MAFYFIVFIIICLLCLYSVAGNREKKISAIFVAAMLILVSGLRRPGIDRDSHTYVEIFDWIGSPLAYFTEYSKYYFYEAGYYLIPAVLKSVFHADVTWFFLVFAFLGVGLKFKAIWKLTEFPMLTIIVYFSHFFILYELTQIRQGVAAGILLLCIPQIERKNLKNFVLLLLIGVFFHYSALILIPIYFLNPHKFNKKIYFAILLIPHLLYLLKVNLITILIAMHLGIVSEKLTLYQNLLDAGIFTEINVYNSVYVLELLFCAFLIWKSDFFYAKNKYAILLIQIYTISLACWVLFSNIPVIAFRTNGYLSIVEIILVPFILYYIEERYVAILFTLLFSAEYLYIDIIHNGLLQPYESVIKLR